MTAPAGNPYESDRILAEYLLFHYGSAKDILPWPDGPAAALDFPRRCAEQGPDFDQLPAGAEVLDLGCAVGRTTFELAARGFRCLGVDYSHAFIGAAEKLRREGKLDTRVTVEGGITQPFTARRCYCDPDNVRFEVGDAHCLRPDIGSFDLVIACNLLCRLREPRALLDRFASLVRPGGQLFLTTPCTWLEEYTPRDNWLCGDSGEADTLAGIRTALGPSFRLVRTLDMPFLIREHARKFQWSVALGSLWTAC